MYVNQKATKQLRIKCRVCVCVWGGAKKSLYITDTSSSCNPDRPRAVSGGGEHYDDDDNDNKNDESSLLLTRVVNNYCA